MADRMTILTANLGFSTTPSATKLTPDDCDNGFLTLILQFLVVDRCPNHLANLLSSSSSSKILNLALEFRRYQSQLRRCNYFRFWGHISISGCRSLFYSLANTIFHLYMVLNLRFVVGVLTVPHSFRDISISGLAFQPFACEKKRFSWNH